MDAAPIQKILYEHLPNKCCIGDTDIGNLAYLVELTRNAPEKLTHGESHKSLRAAIRSILEEVPHMIEEAEKLGEVAKRLGQATDMDQFAVKARLLLEAAKPFHAIAVPRSPRGAWHGWARMMRLTIETGLPKEHRSKVSFQSETGRGTKIIRDLMELAGKKQDESAIVSALKDRKKAN